MHRTDFAGMACSIARTLDVIGEPWSPLILRDVWVGIRRFDEIQADLGISRKVLTERLKWLVDAGVLARREYSRRPPRSEYVLTPSGTELCDLLIVMANWGDRWRTGEAGPPALHRHRTCGTVTRAELRCTGCGEPMHMDSIEVLAGPGAAGPSGEQSAGEPERG